MGARIGKGETSTVVFFFFFFTRGLRYQSCGLSERISGASGRRKSEARQQTLPNFFQKKNFFFEGKKRILYRMFPITGKPENRKRGAFGMDGARFGEGGGWRWEKTQQDKMQEMSLL